MAVAGAHLIDVQGSPAQVLAAAKAKLAELGAELIFEKVLTTSDVSGTGRIVIPKRDATEHLPALEGSEPTSLLLADADGVQHACKYRSWINSQSRMYLIESTQDLQRTYAVKAGDVLIFGRRSDDSYVVCARRGTKHDATRKSPAKAGRPPGEPKAKGPKGKGRGRPATEVDGDKAKRAKQAAADQLQSAYTFWSGYSLPMRLDGVFRAVPPTAAQEPNKVVPQHGRWTAVLALGGELFQAFFDSQEAAQAAFEAAQQSTPGDKGPA